MVKKKRKKYHGESLKFNIFGKPKKIKSPWVKVKNSGIHGKGVFATRDIPKGTKIIEYAGELITKKESDKLADVQYEKGQLGKEGHVYIFDFNKKYDLNGNVPWNTAKYINHSCDPNCEAVDEDNRIWITSTRDIKKGEEVSYNYGYDLENWKEHPCKCGSKRCMGYIVDEKHWGKLKKKLEKEKAR